MPQTPGLVYFQVNRESQLPEWERVQHTLNMAIRLNEKLIVGDIQGQRVLRIKAGNQTVPVEFTLFVVPKEK